MTANHFDLLFHPSFIALIGPNNNSETFPDKIWSFWKCPFKATKEQLKHFEGTSNIYDRLVMVQSISVSVVWKPDHKKLYLSQTMAIGQTLTIMHVLNWIWLCPLASKQHQYLNLCQRHREFPSNLLSKYYSGLMVLNYSAQMGTGASNMAWSLACFSKLDEYKAKHDKITEIDDNWMGYC